MNIDNEETIKKYLSDYKIINPIYTKNKIQIREFPEENKTYLFVQTDGAIYIGTVTTRRGTFLYTIRIEENINNLLQNIIQGTIQILIKYLDPSEKMFMWGEIPGYSENKLSNIFSTLDINKQNKQKIQEFLINEAKKEDDDDTSLNGSILMSKNNDLKRSFSIKPSTINKEGRGKRFIGGRKKTKKNKNKKRKTHKKC